MGYVFVTGSYYGCGNLFTFNPVAVPSIRVKGDRKPICLSCMEAANDRRERMGLDPRPIRADAYGACDEASL